MYPQIHLRTLHKDATLALVLLISILNKEMVIVKNGLNLVQRFAKLQIHTLQCLPRASKGR